MEKVMKNGVALVLAVGGMICLIGKKIYDAGVAKGKSDTCLEVSLMMCKALSKEDDEAKKEPEETK